MSSAAVYPRWGFARCPPRDSSSCWEENVRLVFPQPLVLQGVRALSLLNNPFRKDPNRRCMFPL